MSALVQPRLRLAALAALLLGGCAPSLEQLVAQRSFPDALCYAEIHQLDAPARRRLLLQMGRAAGQTLRIDVVPQAALLARGKPGAALSRGHVVLRLAWAMPRFGYARSEDGDADYPAALVRDPERSAIEAIFHEVELELRVGRRPLAAEPTSLARVVELTGEEVRRLPNYGGGGSGFLSALRHAAGILFMPFELVGVVSGTVVNVATLGAARSLAPHYRPFEITEGLLRDPPAAGSGGTAERPSIEEYRASSPLAAALEDLRSSCFGAADRCHLLLIERPANEATVPILARLRWAYAIQNGAFPRCPLRDELILKLPPGPTLEARIEAAFGGGPRRLEALFGGAQP